jgi:ribonuclease VapC
MFFDASAIIAMIIREPKAHELLLVLEKESGRRYCSPMAKYEAVVGLARAKGKTVKNHKEKIKLAEAVVTKFFVKLEIELLSTTPEQAEIAIGAFSKFGRGSGHPAKLNMGDCFAYAMAKSLKVPLLFVGNDFIHTDIKSALKDPVP